MNWQKSTYSSSNGCVEVAWVKSSYSISNGTCVEVAHHETRILVRDSKNPDGPILEFTEHEWNAFCKGIKAGELQ